MFKYFVCLNQQQKENCNFIRNGEKEQVKEGVRII